MIFIKIWRNLVGLNIQFLTPPTHQHCLQILWQFRCDFSALQLKVWKIKKIFNPLPTYPPKCGKFHTILQIIFLNPFLRSFCLRELNVCYGNHQNEIKFLVSQLPTFWKVLVEICNHNKSEFLPRNVNNENKIIIFSFEHKEK